MMKTYYRVTKNGNAIAETDELSDAMAIGHKVEKTILEWRHDEKIWWALGSKDALNRNEYEIQQLRKRA